MILQIQFPPYEAHNVLEALVTRAFEARLFELWRVGERGEADRDCHTIVNERPFEARLMVVDDGYLLLVRARRLFRGLYGRFWGGVRARPMRPS